eukprot:TRINITY_DN3525_c0_g6_i1.p1 TRINITY_DN3525_c0_g6~~TRINITY_DN3525_c0_g6_i1.p1  ORF type:complete len:389 (-),score=87.77 TRINITY_DN3525_c0_g6_i1:107-1273(-)
MEMENQFQKAQTRDGYKLFVGQIPKTFTEEELRPYFSPYGNIVEIAILRDKATGTSRGCGFVTFIDKSSADSAISDLHDKNPIPPMSKPLQVKFADSEMDKLEHKLFVGMIPRDITEEKLKGLFSPYGQIIEVAIIRPGKDPQKVSAFVKFSKREEALSAMSSLNGQMIEGSIHPMVVKFADSDKTKAKKYQHQLTHHGMYAQNTPLQFYSQLLSNPLVLQQLSSLLGMSSLGGMSMGANGANPVAPNAMASTAYYNPTTAGTHNTYTAPSTDINPILAAYSSFASLPVTPSGGASQQVEGPPGCNLFIYHLPKEFGDTDLAVTFSPFGPVISAKVFIDKTTGESRCFGFVSYDNVQSAQNAILNMNGQSIRGKRLKVQLKKERNTPY